MNTAFFHHHVNHRRLHSRILSVTTESREIITEPLAVRNHIVSHFHQLLSGTSTTLQTPAPDLNGFIGKTCQIHVVNFQKKYTPRKLLFAVFDYAFNKAGVETLIGVVNSNNEKAMKYDQNLGFKEVCRLEGMHDDGGDLVLFQMKKADCRFIREKKYAV